MATVEEDEKNDLLLVDGHEYDGFIDDTACETCSELRIYSSQYDAFFCAHCNKWIDEACKDPGCQFCSKRPWKPVPNN